MRIAAQYVQPEAGLQALFHHDIAAGVDWVLVTGDGLKTGFFVHADRGVQASVGQQINRLDTGIFRIIQREFHQLPAKALTLKCGINCHAGQLHALRRVAE